MKPGSSQAFYTLAQILIKLLLHRERASAS
jgi:hypothetical protein